jgi:hypothetical protein
VIIPDPFLRHKLRKLVPFIFISYGWHRIFRGEKESIKIIRGFSCYLIQNTWRIFGSVIVFFRGEGWIHTGRKWAPYSAPPGGETVWRRNWRRKKWMDFSVFLIVVHRFCILYSAFYILHSIFCILRLCILHFRRMHHVKNILEECILHFRKMHAILYKMHVHNVTRILNCILITIQLYITPTPVSIVTDILLLYNNL